MGGGSWDEHRYAAFTSDAAEKSREALYTRRSRTCATKSKQQVNIEDITIRESCDSEDNPLSTAVIVGLDVTGSMGFIPEALTKGALGKLMNNLLEQQPVTDPHLCFLGIGDTFYDKAPLQATQFEADNRIGEQMQDLWLEGGGGGNHFESYDTAWAFAAYRTKIDCFERRKQKGFLFTVGDEPFPDECNQDWYKQAFHGDCPQGCEPKLLLADAQDKYNVFHIIIEEGSYTQRRLDKVIESWRPYLQSRLLVLGDHEKLAELIVAAMALEQGVEKSKVLQWFDRGTANIIEEALH